LKNAFPTLPRVFKVTIVFIIIGFIIMLISHYIELYFSDYFALHPWIKVLKSIFYLIIATYLVYYFINKNYYKKENLLKFFAEDENRYQELFQGANDSISYLKNLRVVDCNDKTLELFKCTLSDLIGKSVIELSPQYQPDGRKTVDVLNELKEQIEKGRINRIHWWLLRPDHTRFDAEVSLNSINISGERFNIVIIRDISATKEAELALKQSEERYRIINENINDLIWKMDENLKYTYVSPSIAKLRGFSVEEVTQMTIDQVLTSDSYEKVESLIKKKFYQCKNNIDEGFEPFSIELEQFRKDNSTFWVQVNARVVKNEEDHTLEMVGISRDISERRKMELMLFENEERYKRLSDVAFEGIIIHNEGIINDVNKSLLKMLGYQKEEVIGKDMFTFMIPKTYRNLVLKNMHIDYTPAYEAEFIKKTGDYLSVEIEAQNYLESGKKMRVAAVRDISERKKMQQKILQTIINTEEDERARIARELHDGIGPLLSASKIYLNVMLNDLNEKRRVEANLHIAETIEEAIKSVQEISNNLSPHILQNFGLTKALESFSSKFYLLTSTKISIHSNLEVRINKEVEITLYRVIVELINNSLKYAGAEEINVEIDYQDSNLRVVYSDNGKGFDIEKAFQEAKGMGMFNIFSRLSSIDGKIVTESLPGKGFNASIQIFTSK
jgi:PAS domain S-box-containing protein